MKLRITLKREGTWWDPDWHAVRQGVKLLGYIRRAPHRHLRRGKWDARTKDGTTKLYCASREDAVAYLHERMKQ